MSHRAARKVGINPQTESDHNSHPHKDKVKDKYKEKYECTAKTKSLGSCKAYSLDSPQNQISKNSKTILVLFKRPIHHFWTQPNSKLIYLNTNQRECNQCAELWEIRFPAGLNLKMHCKKNLPFKSKVVLHPIVSADFYLKEKELILTLPLFCECFLVHLLLWFSVCVPNATSYDTIVRALNKKSRYLNDHSKQKREKLKEPL